MSLIDVLADLIHSRKSCQVTLTNGERFVAALVYGFTREPVDDNNLTVAFVVGDSLRTVSAAEIQGIESL